MHLAIALDHGVQLIGLVWIDHGGFQTGHLGGQGTDRANAIHHGGDGALARHLANILAEIADGHAGIDRHQTIVWRLLSCDHSKQCGLAGTVWPDQPDLLALLDPHRGFDEQDLVAVLFRYVVESDHGRSANVGERRTPVTVRGQRGIGSLSTMSWFDQGRLYYWIHEQAALAGEVSKVWMILQC